MEERRFCLYQTLSLNRRNALARRALEALGQGPSRSPLERATSLGKEQGKTFWLPALGYLVLLTVAEILTALVEPRLGLLLHSLLLTGALIYGARCSDQPAYRFWMGVSLAPLIRLISLSLPLQSVPLVYWYLIISVPLYVATFIVRRWILQIPWDQVGLHGRGLTLQVLMLFLGLPLGMLEYQILRPVPLISGWNPGEFLMAALILLISTGLVEELIFRGVMQQVAMEMMGKQGVVYVSAIFAVLHIGHRSLTDVFFVFGVALLFSWFVQRTRSIVGVSLTHGLINIWIFLIAPFWGT
ncbi:MAG: CPBP family intramembrane metalloprotease [Thermoflexales bacterium]|nr:CPBP family intramembrane metalloprotease [Thermoflexales bacterium]